MLTIFCVLPVYEEHVLSRPNMIIPNLDFGDASIPRAGAIHANYILCITCIQGTCFV